MLIGGRLQLDSFGLLRHPRFLKAATLNHLLYRLDTFGRLCLYSFDFLKASSIISAPDLSIAVSVLLCQETEAACCWQHNHFLLENPENLLCPSSRTKVLIGDLTWSGTIITDYGLSPSAVSVSGRLFYSQPIIV